MILKPKEFRLILFFIALLSCGANNSSEEKTEKFLSSHSEDIHYVFNKHLSLLDSMVTDKYPDVGAPLNQLQVSIEFMEELTKIPSEADGSDIGRLNITHSDYQNWKNWYLKNKQFLRWDSLSQKIVDTRTEIKKDQ